MDSKLRFVERIVTDTSTWYMNNDGEKVFNTRTVRVLQQQQGFDHEGEPKWVDVPLGKEQ